MNLNKIEETWNAYSKLKNIELKFKERNQGNLIQSHYLINYTNEIATFSFIGILWKSSEGQDTDKTSIIVEFNNRLAINNFDIKTSDHSKEVLTEFENSILKDLEGFDANSITLKDNFIRLDTNHIFSTMENFNLVEGLVLRIKTTANNR